jgi:hypothetical protein
VLWRGETAGIPGNRPGNCVTGDVTDPLEVGRVGGFAGGLGLGRFRALRCGFAEGTFGTHSQSSWMRAPGGHLLGTFGVAAGAGSVVVVVIVVTSSWWCLAGERAAAAAGRIAAIRPAAASPDAARRHHGRSSA